MDQVVPKSVICSVFPKREREREKTIYYVFWNLTILVKRISTKTCYAIEEIKKLMIFDSLTLFLYISAVFNIHCKLFFLFSP